MIGQVLRYINVYRYILEEIATGTYGKPFAMRTIRTMGRWGSWSKPWRLRHATCGGLLLEVNVHEIDLMLRILGEATSVTAFGSRFVNDEVDYEDFVTAQITFAEGKLGSITSGSSDFLGKNAGEVFLKKGTIYFDSVTQQLHIRRDGEDRRTLPYGGIHPDWETGTYREMREFIEACLGEHPVTIPGEEAIRAVEIGEAAYLSIRERRTISLPLPRN